MDFFSIICLHNDQKASHYNDPPMADQEGTKKERAVNRDAEQVLREAEIIARWAKKPFYIS